MFLLNALVLEWPSIFSVFSVSDVRFRVAWNSQEDFSFWRKFALATLYAQLKAMTSPLLTLSRGHNMKKLQ